MFFLKKNTLLKSVFIVFLGIFLSNNSFADDADGIFNAEEYKLFKIVKGDFLNFYSLSNLKVMAASFALGGVLANTSADESMQSGYQDNIRSENTDDFSKTAKLFGEGKYLIPLSLAAATVGYFIPEDSGASVIGTWGANTARAYLVGAPPMLLMQVVTGASRPDEGTVGDSSWSPFEDNNGVSGHSFMGAVPFITLAKMYKDNPVKWFFYGASFLASWSRVNDNDHYVSQSALGWVMAYQSVRSVFMTDKQRENPLAFNIYPYGSKGAGLLVSYSF
ncbi:MAG: phosphatase PAP2 family protein [Desulfobacula sp.]|nr:phosphatase PAP2 family protein [Desulfobacula sp.]